MSKKNLWDKQTEAVYEVIREDLSNKAKKSPLLAKELPSILKNIEEQITELVRSGQRPEVLVFDPKAPSRRPSRVERKGKEKDREREI